MNAEASLESPYIDSSGIQEHSINTEQLVRFYQKSCYIYKPYTETLQ